MEWLRSTVFAWRPTPVSLILGWQTLFWAGVILLFLAGCAAHVPRQFPGRLTEHERGTGGGHALVRLLGLCLLPFAALACWAAASTVLPLRRPVVLVLHSRARVTPASIVRPASQGSLPVYDLGPAVDRILESCQAEGAGQWVSGQPHERERIAEIVEKEAWPLDRIHADSQPCPPGTGAKLPKWVVESVEISLVQYLAAALRIGQVHVAAAPSPGVTDGWPLAATILSQQRIPTECAAADTSGANGLLVERLMSARLDAGGNLSFAAVISGRIQAGSEAPPPLMLRLSDKGKYSSSISVRLTADDSDRRAKFLRIPPVPRAEQVPDRRQLFLVDDVSGCETNVRRAHGAESAPQVSAWQWLGDTRELRAALETHGNDALQEWHDSGLRLPTPAGAGPDSAGEAMAGESGLFVWACENYIVVGQDRSKLGAVQKLYDSWRSTAIKRQFRQASPPEPAVPSLPVSSLRVTSSLVSCPGALAWQGLPIPLPAGFKGGYVPSAARKEGLSLVEDSLVLWVLVWADAVVTQPASRGVSSVRRSQRLAGTGLWPVVSAAQVSEGGKASRFIIIDLVQPVTQFLPPLPEKKKDFYDPSVFAAVVATIASADLLLGDQREGLSSVMETGSESAQDGPQAGPVFSGDDISVAAARARRRSDVLGALVLGVYFLSVALWVRTNRRSRVL